MPSDEPKDGPVQDHPRRVWREPMSYVYAAYIATLGSFTLYGARLVVRSRQVASALLRQSRDDVATTDDAASTDNAAGR